MFPLLSLRVSYFPCHVEVSLDSKLERIFSKKKKKKEVPEDFSKHIVSNGQIQLILNHKYTFTLCSYHFNTPFSVILQYPQSKNKILCQKEKRYSVKLHDFLFVLYVG